MSHNPLAATLEALSAAHVAAHREYLELHEQLLQRAHQAAEGIPRSHPQERELAAHRAASRRLHRAAAALDRFLRGRMRQGIASA